MQRLLDEQVEELLKTAVSEHKFDLTAKCLREQITGEEYTSFLPS